MSRLKKNIAYNMSGQFIVLGLSFISVKYIHGQLGADVLGIIFFTSMVNLLVSEVLQTGVATTTVREVSSHYESDKKYVRDYLRTGTSFYWGCFLLVTAVIVYAAPLFVEHWITLEELDKETAIHILRVLGVSSLIVLPRWHYVSMLRGIERMDWTALIDVLTTALQHAGTIFLIIQGYGVEVVVYWFGFCYVLRIGIYMAVCLFFFELSMMIPGFKSYVLGRNSKYTSRLIFSTVISAVLRQFDKIVLSKLLPIGAVGYYGFLNSGLSKTRIITSSVGQAAFPTLSKMFEGGEKEEMLKTYDKIQDLVVFSSVPLFAAAVYVGLPGLSFIFDTATAQDLFAPFLFLCLGLYLNAVLTIPQIFTLACGNSGIEAKQHILDALIYPAAAFFLILEYGLVGASLAMVLLQSLHVLYGLRRSYKECFKRSYLGFCLHQAKILLFACLVFGAPFSILYVFGHAHDIILITVVYLCSLLLFAVLGFFLLTEMARDLIKANLMRVQALLTGMVPIL
jgi:O-antigen/teichoic acid export membrane protein